MKSILSSLLVLLMLGMSTAIYAQEVEINEVKKRHFRGVKSILDKETGEATGYYITYVAERGKIGKRIFAIAIYDLDLKLVKELPVEMTKNAEIESSAYNGENFMFIFKDPMMKQMTYITASNKGELLKQDVVQEKKPQEIFAEVYPSDDGFIIAKPDKEKKIGYKITKVDANQNQQWETSLIPKKGYNDIEDIKVTGDQVIAITVDYPKKGSKKGEGSLTAFSKADGSELWSYLLYDGEHQHIPSAFLVDSDGNTVAGGMFFGGAKWENNDAEGIFLLKLDADGKQISLTTKEWEKDIQQVIKQTAAKTLGKPKVYFQEIVEKEDGYQLVGETFKMTIKATQAVAGAMAKTGGMMGMAGKMAKFGSKVKTKSEGRYIGDPDRDDDAGAGSMLQGSIAFDIEDFVIVNFNKEGEMEHIKMINKDKLSIMVYPPYTFGGGVKTARIIEDHGFFQYKFTTSIPGVSDEVIVSANMTQRNPYIGVTDISGEEIGETVEHEVKFKAAHMQSKNNDSYVGAVKSKPGKMLVYYYDKKEKTVVMYLEDLKAN